MNTGIKSECAALLSMCFCVVSVSMVAAQSTQKITMDEVKRFIGSGVKGGNSQRLGQIDCVVYRSASGDAYVDRSTGKVVRVHYRSVRPRGRDIGMTAARRKVMDWMKRHGVDLLGWTPDPDYRFDHGGGDVGYSFGWHRRAPNGAYLPSMMSAIISSGGEMKSWLRIDLRMPVSAVPTISAKQAQDIIAKKLKAKFGLKQSPELRTWFRNGKQRLYWRILFHTKDDPWCMGGAEIDAHTGELLDFYPPQRPKGLPGARTR